MENKASTDDNITVENLRTTMEPLMYLQEVGLTEYESRAYVCLLDQGVSTANQIANGADIPQQRVYDVLEGLEEQGFAEIQPGRPKKFGPVDPEQALERYCEYKQRAFDEELSRIDRLGDKLIEATASESTTVDPEICWTYSNRHQILDKLGELAAMATSEIRMITTPLSFERILNHHAEELAARAKEGVSIQAIVDNTDSISRPIRDRSEQFMQLHRTDGIAARIYMYDSSHVLLAFATGENSYAGILTDNQTFSQTVSSMFDTMWENQQYTPNSVSD